MTPEPVARRSPTAELMRQAHDELLLESRSEADSPLAARWLCLVPAWTPVLATRCGLPGWSAGMEGPQLHAWRAAGLLESTMTPLSIDETGQFVPAQRVFWMPHDTRAAWLSRMLAEDGRDQVTSLMREIAQRLLAQPRDRHLPLATLRWATLASAASAPTRLLRETFDPALDQALARERQDEAWLWIEALQRVADVLPGEATMLHQRAVRRLALFDRERNDRAFLRDYLPRPDQFQAWRDLLTGPDEAWALHYLGGGGVGKTMLMRALTSGTAEHFPAGFQAPATVTARIDFDHINPDYPAKRPGLLFAHLAEEMRLKDESGRAVDQFARVFHAIGFLHESATHPAVPAAIDDVLEMFAWACDAVASEHRAPVVLLLDTCEELARLGPDGRLPDSVQRTFELLERLHELLPSMRVVLCGRRPLAGTYAGGEVVSSDLPARPWLRLHRMFAFSEDEARAYLSRASVPGGLVGPILSRSSAAASSASTGLAAADTATRYSPFSLSVYATWVTRRAGEITADEILSDPVDHFVRIRILDRIHNADVRRLLPHVALLGRFDEATLRACADVRPDMAEAVCREIAAQEWISRQAGGYHAVEPELRVRLLRYFRQEAPQVLESARKRVLAVVRARLEEAPDGAMPDEPLWQALVQLQIDDPAGLLAAWRVLDTRIVAGTESAWGERVVGRLLADESFTDGVPEAGAWGAFMATYAECVLRERGAAATADLWRRSWEWLQSLEPSEQRASLLVRVASGGVVQASAAPDTEMAFDTWVLRLYTLLSEREVALTVPDQVAPVIAALMACADAAELRDDLEPAPPMLERIAGLVAEVRRAPERALALACIGRFAARRQDADLGRKRFVDALQILSEASDREHVRSLHWPVTFDVASWVTLEAMRGLAGLEPVEDTLARFDALPAARLPIAHNRLAALRLRLAGAQRMPSGSHESWARGAATPIGGDMDAPSTAGHIAVPPHSVVRALDVVAAGRPAEGLRHLSELASMAASVRQPTLATTIARAQLEAITRMRLGEIGLLARQIGGGTTALPLVERERMHAFLPEPSPAAGGTGAEEARTRADRHAVWRARRAFDEPSRLALAQWGLQFLTSTGIPDGQGEWARASLALDLVECSDLGAEVELAPHGLSPLSPEDWWNRHPALPEHALRLWIRSAALGVSPGGPTSPLVRRVGTRRAAAIALDEGELLALRLPGQALRLLALALTWYEDAHDVVGIWQVTTLLTLTRVRAGVSRDSVDLGALRAAHEALVAASRLPGGPDALPSWQERGATTHLPLGNRPTGAHGLAGDGPAIAPPPGPEWIPWLHRLVALQQWVHGGLRPEVLFGDAAMLPIELREWPSLGAPGLTTITQVDVAAASASRAPAPGAAGAAPPSVAVPPAAIPPTAPASPNAPVEAPTNLPVVTGPAAPPRLPTREVTGLVLAAVAVVAVAAIALVAGAPTWATGLGLGLVLLAGVLLWHRRRRRAVPVIPAWTAQVSLATGSVTTGRLSPLDVAVALADDRGVHVTSVSMRIRRTDAFSGLDALRQPPAGTALSTPLPQSPPLERVWLDVALSTAWPCWEALLWSGTVEHERLHPAVVRRVRAARALPALTARAAGPWTVAAIAATSSDERQAVYAWEPAVRGGHVRLQPVPAEQVRQAVPQVSVDVAHVVARPVETAQGLFLEVTGGERAHAQETLESLEAARGTLFDASQVAGTFPSALCTLLQSPRRPTLDVTPASRESSAQLRIIGAALAEQGVPVVVVLPPLDGELGAELVRLLGRRLAAMRTGRRFDPHEFTTRAREVVFTLAQRMLPRDPAIELALQVTVYVARS